MHATISTTYLDEFVSRDFNRALRRGVWRAVVSWLTRRCNRLLPLDQGGLAALLRTQHEAGLQVVALDQIVGSLGRFREFDRAFYPRRPWIRERWLSLARARYQGVSLPPVELIKVGAQYFVSDGNHRISVARAWGQKFIDARVIEVELEDDKARLDSRSCPDMA